MKKLNSPRNTSWLVAFLATGLSAVIAHATPYATELANTSGTVSFTLNEAADNVKITYSSTTTVLGPLAAGSYSTNIGATSPFAVEVTKNGGIGYKTATAPNVAGKIQISTDPLLSIFNSPRGVAVNKNPGSPFFGRIYVANSAAGASGSRTLTGKGLYTLKADFSDSPNAYGNAGQQAGLPYAAASANAPLKLSVGPDSYVYVADYGDASSLVSRMDGNLQNGQLVLDYIGGPSTLPTGQNHGSTFKVMATGSLETGDLAVYTVDEDYKGASGAEPTLSLWRYDIGSGPLTNQNHGTKILTPYWNNVSLLTDFVIGTNGYFYVLQYRAIQAPPNTTGPALSVYDSGGILLTNSLDMWREINADPSILGDVLTNAYGGIAISPNNKYLALNLLVGTWILPLKDGIPDIANRLYLDTGTTANGRSCDFDIAGNLYTVSSGDARLRAFSPGGPSVATTTSDGTFNLFVPEAEVSVAATVATISESGGPGMFTLSRSGDLSEALTVGFSLGGTATSGVDYQTIPLTVTFAPGAATTNIFITPINDSISEPTETVILTLSSNPDYALGTPTATVTIVDDDIPAIDITTVRNSVYERNSYDYARFRLTRLGRTNESVTVNLNYGGTATAGVDFNPVYSVTLAEGDTTATFDINPIDDALVEGNESILVTVAPGPGYVAGTNSVTGSATLVDDDVPDQIVLFADDFSVPDASTNWVMYFGSTNTTFPDYGFEYGFDYSSFGIPPAPHSVEGQTRALRMYVNKAAGGAAALNFYLTNQVFAGDYAVRFDMYLMQGTGATTEYALFGINHSGTKTNWFRNSSGGVPGGSFDGLFYGVESDAAALGDYVLYSSPTTTGNNPTALTPGRNASTLSDVFKAPPWASAGAPANLLSTTTPSWADVEISQVGSLISLKINNTLIFSYTNQTAYTSGQIMLGYCDAYDSQSSASAQVFYSNLRVVRAAALSITSIKVESGAVKIGFTWPVSEPTSAFELLSAPTADGSFGVENGATFSVVVPGASYEVTVPVSTGARFYKVHRL